MLSSIVFWVLIAVVAAVVTLLFIPILVRVQVATKPKFTFHSDMRVFMGLAPRITLISKCRKRTPDPVKPKSKRSEKPKISNARLAKAAPGLIMDIVRNLHLHSLELDCEFGMEDPSDTGQLAGLLLPIAHVTPEMRKVDISLRPNFARPCMEGEITAVIRLTLAAFFLPFARFAWRSFGPTR